MPSAASAAGEERRPPLPPPPPSLQLRDDTMCDVKYRQIRANEEEAWLEHVHGVFGEAKGDRAPPRSYFERHVRNDPAADLPNSAIVATVAGEAELGNSGGEGAAGERIVGTVRVFRRRMYLRGGTVQVGGIGEVSVQAAYRRRGIARRLLHEAVALMEREGFALSSLHTSDVAPVYAALGWQSTPRRDARIRRRVRMTDAGDDGADGRRTRPLRLDAGENEAGADDVAACMRMYDTFSRRFDGPFVRDDRAYWQRWVRDESGGVAWKPESMTPRARVTAARDAYMIAQHRTDENGAEVVHVREFAVGDESVARADERFDALLAGMVRAEKKRRQRPKPLIDDATWQSVTVVLPMPLLELLAVDKQREIEQTRVDDGTMYRVVSPTLLIPSERGVGSDGHEGVLREERHIFWPTDAF